MPVSLKFRGEETFLLSVTSFFPFGVKVDKVDKRAMARSLCAASNKEQPSIAATKSNTVPPAPQEKQWKTLRARFT
jgi:hypothetical protein